MSGTAHLSDRSVLAVAGSGARGFLQDLVTNDLETLAPAQAAYAALLTPQGKILHDFFVVVENEGRFLIDCASDRAEELLRRLTLYRLRAKLDIGLAPLQVFAVWPAATSVVVRTILVRDPRHADLGFRILGDVASLPQANAGPDEYRLHCLQLGIPASSDLPADQIFALDAGFEELGGVNFKKGCFVGQEVTARMKHRASARRRPFIAEISPSLPPPGTPLIAAGREVGTLATGMGTLALAYMRLDRLAEAVASSEQILADGKPVQLSKPGWLRD